VRSDNGTEYVNQQFNNYFKNNGIIHEKSSPYTPEQNSRIERDNRSIAESARTMLLDANLSQDYWAEAVNCATYLLNRRPCKANNDKLLIKNGSIAFVHIPKQFRTKWDRKSEKMIMVGYDGYSSKYRLFNQETRKITVARDVIFNEKS